MTPLDNAARNKNDYNHRCMAYEHLAAAINLLSKARAELTASASAQARDVQNHALMVQRDADGVLASCVSLARIIEQDERRMTWRPSGKGRGAGPMSGDICAK